MSDIVSLAYGRQSGEPPVRGDGRVKERIRARRDDDGHVTTNCTISYALYKTGSLPPQNHKNSDYAWNMEGEQRRITNSMDGGEGASTGSPVWPYAAPRRTSSDRIKQENGGLLQLASRPSVRIYLPAATAPFVASLALRPASGKPPPLQKSAAVHSSRGTTDHRAVHLHEIYHEEVAVGENEWGGCGGIVEA